MPKAFRATTESQCHACRCLIDVGDLAVEGARKRIVHLRCVGEMTDQRRHSIHTSGADPKAYERGEDDMRGGSGTPWYA